jgi:hypothetical protein
MGGFYEDDRRWAEANIIPFESFDDFVKTGLQKPSIQRWKHFRPQSNFLYVPLNGKLQVNYLGYFENIQDDFQHIANRIGMGNSAVLSHENVGNLGKRSDYTDYYTDKTRDIVSEVYKRDIDNFGYSFDNSSLGEQLKRRQLWTT